MGDVREEIWITRMDVSRIYDNLKSNSEAIF